MPYSSHVEHRAGMKKPREKGERPREEKKTLTRHGNQWILCGCLETNSKKVESTLILSQFQQPIRFALSARARDRAKERNSPLALAPI
jgi:hypothetical protein